VGNQPVVKSEVLNGVGWIRLNRPRALNALSLEMVEIIEGKLQEWITDESVLLVCLEGEGGKGLCAGGDIRSLYDRKDSNVEALALPFFSTEYRVDCLIHRYPKPIVAFMDGIVMGGGVGISYGAKYRIVTDRTKWAMPEMNIGFFPDVGSSYFLNQMPGFAGRYLALTSEVITAGDVLYIGAADRYMPSEQWGDLQERLNKVNWSDEDVESQLQRMLDEFTTSTLPDSSLAELQGKIDQYFSGDSIEEILASLEDGAIQGDEWASQIAATMRAKSPTSLKVTLKQLQQGAGKPLEQCFEMELGLSMNFMKCHDFYEGVRSVLVDKDRNPKWNPNSLHEVSEPSVLSFFNNPWKGLRKE
jgi:enoyl-CoA hydratase